MFKTGDQSIQLIDLPGTYSLVQHTPDAAVDERITADCIELGDFDCVVNVVDAANLERNLYLSCQLIERGVPLIVVVNRVDLIAKDRVIDYQALSQHLGCPVVPVCAINKQGFTELEHALLQPTKNTQSKIRYPLSIHKIIESTSSSMSPSQCLSALEGSYSASGVSQGQILKWQQEVLHEEGFDADICIARKSL